MPKNRIVFILSAAAVPLIARLLILPWLAPPEPNIPDEFSHLLVADTLLSGRLANPPHPLWQHLDTIYVLQQPSYASIYPIGQGIALALGKLLTGTYWGGILLSTALMCGGISWMLFGCLPETWAALGGLLAAAFYGLKPDWINSYWGGSICAFGGALVFGSLCRLRGRPSKALALTAGVGFLIVWFTRPFESLLVLLVLWSCLFVFLRNDSTSRKRWLGPVAVLLAIQLFGAGLTALHNRAVTGSFTSMPYMLSQEEYGMPQTFAWQPPVPAPQFRFAEAKRMYLWQLSRKAELAAKPFQRAAVLDVRAWEFFLTPWYTVPFLLAFWTKDRLVFLCGAILACAVTLSSVYAFFFPHYLAAYTCLFAFVIACGLMRLLQAPQRSHRAAAWICMAGASAMSLIVFISSRNDPDLRRSQTARAQIVRKLENIPGHHVVFVRYGEHHRFQDEWVYNGADIDASRIVWCRALGPARDIEVARYYKDRQTWILDVTPGVKPQLSRYTPEIQVSALPNPGQLVPAAQLVAR